MSLRDIQSIDKATDRELLVMILSTQVQLARRIEFLEAKIKNEKFDSVPNLCDTVVLNTISNVSIFGISIFNA